VTAIHIEGIYEFFDKITIQKQTGKVIDVDVPVQKLHPFS